MGPRVVMVIPSMVLPLASAEPSLTLGWPSLAHDSFSAKYVAANKQFHSENNLIERRYNTNISGKKLIPDNQIALF